MFAILVISLLILVAGFALIIKNFWKAVDNLGEVQPESLFKRHLIALCFVFVGGLGTTISGIALIVQYLTHK